MTGNANYLTEGGNVTDVNLTANESTEKWAGFYGNVTGSLTLQKGTTTIPLYTWSWSMSNGGEVCASTASNFPWASATAAVRAGIDTAWSFATGDTDSATSTFTDTSCSISINPVGALSTTGVFTKNSTNSGVWQTCAVDDGGAGESNFAFCVNMSSTNTFAVGGTGAYQLMVPTTETAGATELYYFYAELT
ncbi:MAG: hypothetical protein AB1657_00030 [Candidatus Micrarchaeota archaeon]